MANKLYSQREFAKLVGLSLSTVSSMVKSKSLIMQDGKIVEEEVSRFRFNKLKQFASQGTLILSFDTDVAYNDAWKAEFSKRWEEATNSKPMYFQSVDSIFDMEKKDTSLSDAQVINLRLKYNTKVLSLFISRYNEAVNKFFCSLLNDSSYKEISTIPAILLQEYIKFGKFISTDIFDDSILETYQSVISEKSAAINDFMNNQCLRISKDLALLDMNTKKPLIERDLLTLEFFNKQGTLYDSFFTCGNNKKDPKVFDYNKSIYGSILNDFTVKSFNRNLDYSLSKGYFTLLAIDITNKSTFLRDTILLHSLVAKGLFNNLFILASKDDFINNTPKELKDYLDIAFIANPCKVNFAFQ